MQHKDVISVFGLGKLGCTMLACFAAKGWNVVGVDIIPEVIEKVNNGISPVYEPGVDELIKANKERITATNDVKTSVLNSDVSFVIVPTPSLPSGKFDTRLVENVLKDIAAGLREKHAYHLVVITSTVLPGDMDQLKQLLEEMSGKKCNADFGVCYNPDFIALGNIVHDFTNPDLVLIGESDKKAGDMLHSVHERLVKNQPGYQRMNFYNAELCKIAINSYCTLKITFANVIADICEKMPGGDADIVTKALGADSRIGKKYIKGGLSYGGPCFPRDNRAFGWVAHRFGVKHVLSEQTDLINNYQRSDRLPGKIESILKENDVNEIAVLGLTYKHDTTLVEESAGLYITKSLLQKGYHVTVYDPAGISDAKKELAEFGNIKYALSVNECLQGKKVCMITSPWKEFTKLRTTDFLKHMAAQPVVVDGWSLFNEMDDASLTYIRIGKN